MEEELLDLVDENDRVVGTALRRECHGNPACLHRAVHLFVLNPSREIYLQCRNLNKLVQPGKWDTSVGGHIPSGEDYVGALFREAEEELALTDFSPCYMYSYIMHNNFESELIGSFICVTTEELHPNPDEISEGRFWTEPEIMAALGSSVFTPNFEEEYDRFTDWRLRYPHRYAALFDPKLDGNCKSRFSRFRKSIPGGTE